MVDGRDRRLACPSGQHSRRYSKIENRQSKKLVLSEAERSRTDRKRIGGEDRNRTYLDSACAGSTTVLKTARATRHPSLSGVTKKMPNLQRPTVNIQLKRLSDAIDYLSFLVALTISSKSGHSPVSSLEWRSLSLARISNAPPLEGIRVSDLIRSPSSRILVAKLTALGV